MSIQCSRNSLATRFFTWDGTFQHPKSHIVGYSFSNDSFSLPAISHNLCTIAIVIAGRRPFQNQCSLGVFFGASLSKLLWVLICRFLTKEQGWLNGYTSCLGGNKDFRVGSTLWMRLKQHVQAVSLTTDM
jgi:hypothetical protein